MKEKLPDGLYLDSDGYFSALVPCPAGGFIEVNFKEDLETIYFGGAEYKRVEELWYNNSMKKIKAPQKALKSVDLTTIKNPTTRRKTRLVQFYSGRTVNVSLRRNARSVSLEGTNAEVY